MEELEHRNKSPFWFLRGNFFVLLVCRIMWTSSISIVNPFLSLYILALGGTPTEIGLISSLGLLAGMFLYPFGGYVADHSGRVKLVAYSTYIYATTFLLFIFAPNWQFIALGQFLSQLCLFYVPAMNALETDSLPPFIRGRGFAVMMAVPGAIRIVAPYVGGWIIKAYGGGDAGLIQAIRLCWSIATVTGIVVATIRLRYLRESLTVDEREEVLTPRSLPRTLKSSYASIVGSIRWMDRPLRSILLVQIVSSFFVAMTAPFWVVYATRVLGIDPYQWGIALLISGFVGIFLAFPLGSLVDRIGPRKMILSVMALAPLSIFMYAYSGGFLGVVAVLGSISIINSTIVSAFSTLIAHMVPRKRRGRIYSLLGERGIQINVAEYFWGGGFLLFPAAAVGAFIGGYVYEMTPSLPWLIFSTAMVFCLVLTFLFIKEPMEAQ